MSVTVGGVVGAVAGGFTIIAVGEGVSAGKKIIDQTPERGFTMDVEYGALAEAMADLSDQLDDVFDEKNYVMYPLALLGKAMTSWYKIVCYGSALAVGGIGAKVIAKNEAYEDASTMFSGVEV